MGKYRLGDTSLSEIPTWVEIVLTIQSGAEPGCMASKHTCNARFDVRKPVWLCVASPQNYRVKRLSACGGCLGDYRR